MAAVPCYVGCNSTTAGKEKTVSWREFKANLLQSVCNRLLKFNELQKNQNYEYICRVELSKSCTFFFSPNLFFFFRAFGDKSSPPSLPNAEIEEQGLNGEECEAYEEEDKEEVEKCVEEQQTAGEAVTDKACCGIEKLSLVKEEEEEKGEKCNEEQKDNQKTQQGT